MPALPPPVVAGELARLQTRQHVVALTFDGGGNAEGAGRLPAVLRREHVVGTFFLTGDWRAPDGRRGAASCAELSHAR